LGVRDGVLRALERDPQGFLLEWLRWLHVSARGFYLSAGGDPDVSRLKLEAFNDVCLIFAEQLRWLGRGRLAFHPLRNFLDILDDRGAEVKDHIWQSAQTALEHSRAAAAEPPDDGLADLR
jgi:hypothetical protein